MCHGDRSGNQPGPAYREGFRERSGRRDRARRYAGCLAFLPRGDPVADRRRDEDEANSDFDLPLRRHDREGRPYLPSARRGPGRGRVVSDLSTPTAAGTAADGALSDLEKMVAELRAHNRFLLTAHEGPDGDALGSLLGMHQLLQKLGKDSVMFLAAKEFPLPIEYRFLPLEEVFHEPPADMADRTVVFLDCGNIDRMPVEFLTEGDHRILNIDHHHDNTRFGDVNLVAPQASCTAEIVFDIAHLMGVPVDAEMAMPLYVGLITDTGKFMYENTNAHTHRVAAELIDAGVDVDDTYRRLYEHVPIEKLRLVARALESIERHCGDRLVTSYITAADYAATGSGEEMTEGVIDHLRSIDGVKVAAVVRDLGNRGRAARKVSLRSSEGDVDVSAIARKQGGGGHKRAAGFSTDLDLPALVEFLCGEVTAQLGS